MALDFDELVRELKAVRSKGLTSVRRLNLPQLEGAATVVIPAAEVDLSVAVEKLIERAVESLGGGDYGAAAARLMGFEGGTRGLGPKRRQETAADALDMSAETFRTRHMNSMVEDIASRIVMFVLALTDPEMLTVAIGLIVDGGRVVLVRRRRPEGRLEWQFPAGIVKPGYDPRSVIVEEIRNETCIVCRVHADLGSRFHPITRLPCHYFACAYLHGDLANGDEQENSEVRWVPIVEVTSYIDIDMIYQPVLERLQLQAIGVDND